MYVMRSEGMVAIGRAGEFEELSARLGTLLTKHEGFDRGALLTSLGTPGKYVRMDRFVNREAARAWQRSPELAGLLRESSYQQIYASTRPVRAYDLVLAVRGSGEGKHVDIAEWTIDPRPDNTAAYEAGRRELFELRRERGRGFVAGLLLRLLGGGGNYVMYMVSTDREAAQATTAASEVRRFVQSHPAAMYGALSPSPEPYELLQAYLP